MCYALYFEFLLPNILLKAGCSSVKAVFLVVKCECIWFCRQGCVGCDFSHFSGWPACLCTCLLWLKSCQIPWLKLSRTMLNWIWNRNVGFFQCFPNTFAHDVISSVAERKLGFKLWDLNMRHSLVAVQWLWQLTPLSLSFCELMGLISSCLLTMSGWSLNEIKFMKVNFSFKVQGTC